MIEIFTDGACRGNPGPGGWGVLIRHQGQIKELYGGKSITTNNQMELTAVIKGLAAFKKPTTIKVVTDSQYVKKGITEWILNWKKNGWKTANKKPVKNMALWKMLDRGVQYHKVRWQWVKGHSGHLENERADALANRAIDKLLEDN
jgi:ribonuclease HI